MSTPAERLSPQQFRAQVAALQARSGLPAGELAARVAAACARVGIVLGDEATPGALAVKLDPMVVQRPHLELIDDAFARVHAGEIDRVIVSTPPQVGKSLRAAIWGPFWWLTHHPQDRFIVVSYGARLAGSRGRAVRRLVRRYGAAYGLQIDPENAAVDDWSLTSGGGMRTGGMDSGITGTPGDVLVIDDPHKDRAEADSHLVKENIWDTYSSTLLSRLSPGAPIILIQTRWAPDDLAGKVLEEEGDAADGGRWHVIHLPAFADPRFGPDPLGREPGGPLPHPKIPVLDVPRARLHWEEKRRTSTTRDWSALYQGDPIPTAGQLVSEELLAARRHYQPDAKPAIAAVAVDPSGGGRDTAGVVGGWLGDDGRLYVCDDDSGVMGSEGWARATCLLANRLGADRIVAEQNYGGDMVRLTIRTAWDALSREAGERNEIPMGLCPRIVLVHSRRGKLLRAEPIAQQIAEDRMRFAAHLPDLEAEWLGWRPTDPWSPGRIDASVHLAFQLLPVPGAAGLVSTPAGSRKESTGRSGLGLARIAR